MEFKFLKEFASAFKKPQPIISEPPEEIFSKKTGVKVAVIGDFHIPGRAKEIPKEFLSILKREKPDKILCTGDFTTQETFEKLKAFGVVEAVSGNMDLIKFPSEKRISISKYFIGLIHGHGIHPRGDINQIFKKAEDMGVDILVHGHTHFLDMQKNKETLIINPGSATGVWSGGEAEGIPSFMILELNRTIRVRSFKLSNDSVTENLQEFSLHAGKSFQEVKV